MRSPSSRTFAWISSEATSTGPIPSIIQESPPLGSRRAAARPGTSLEETGACCRLAPAVGAVGPRRDQERHVVVGGGVGDADRKSTRLNSSHANISYAVFCLKKKK